ncbi:unnamed protein product [Nippostrongylus brasiliensis]|uniref:Chemotaxis protein CheW n=1 Tax=Nippostrongylus brasiliensis TaxID=27835 RepID=A0A0N4XS06_NIPBR|nr:unnamed protein product [Nippostrongylus brasiliensis]
MSNFTAAIEYGLEEEDGELYELSIVELVCRSYD